MEEANQRIDSIDTMWLPSYQDLSSSNLPQHVDERQADNSSGQDSTEPATNLQDSFIDAMEICDPTKEGEDPVHARMQEIAARDARKRRHRGLWIMIPRPASNENLPRLESPKHAQEEEITVALGDLQIAAGPSEPEYPDWLPNYDSRSASRMRMIREFLKRSPSSSADTELNEKMKRVKLHEDGDEDEDDSEKSKSTSSTGVKLHDDGDGDEDDSEKPKSKSSSSSRSKISPTSSIFSGNLADDEAGDDDEDDDEEHHDGDSPWAPLIGELNGQIREILSVDDTAEQNEQQIGSPMSLDEVQSTMSPQGLPDASGDHGMDMDVEMKDVNDDENENDASGCPVGDENCQCSEFDPTKI